MPSLGPPFGACEEAKSVAKGLQSKGAAPDKNTYRMNKSVAAFEKAVKDGDKKAALAAGSSKGL